METEVVQARAVAAGDEEDHLVFRRGRVDWRVVWRVVWRVEDELLVGGV